MSADTAEEALIDAGDLLASLLDGSNPLPPHIMQAQIKIALLNWQGAKDWTEETT